MARVPTKDQPSVQQASAPDIFSRARATGADFGAIEGAALEQAGKAVVQAAQVAQDFVNRQNETDFKAAKVNYDTQVNAVLYGDGKQNRGFFSTQSKNAMDAGPIALQRIQEIKDSVMEGHNDEVQASLELSLTTAGNRSTANMSRHVTSQRIVYDKQLDDAQIKQFGDDAARNFSSDETVNNSVSAARLITLRSAKRTGVPDEIIDNLMNDAATHVLSESIKAAVKSGDVDRAQELLKDHRKEITGAVAADLTKLLLTASTLAEVQEESDRIISVPGLTHEQRLTEARQNKVPAVREALVTNIKRRNLEETRANKAAVTSAASELSLAISGGESSANWGARNPEQWEAIQANPKVKKQMRSIEKAASEDRIFAIASNGITEAEIRELPENELAAMPLEELALNRANLTKEEWERAIKLWDVAKEKQNTRSENAVHYKNGDKVVRQFAPKAFGFGVAGVDDEVRKKQRAALSQMAVFVKDTIIATGKAPSIPDMQAQAQIIFRRGEIGGPVEKFLFLGSTKFGTEVRQLSDADKKTFTVKLSDIDDTVTNAAIKTFNDFGIDPSKAQVEQFLGAEAVGDADRQRRLLGEGPRASAAAPKIKAAGIPFPKITAPKAQITTPKTGETFAQRIRRFEGTDKQPNKGRKVFDDPAGNKAIGVGFNLERPDAKQKMADLGKDIKKILSGEQTLTDAQVTTLFEETVLEATQTAKKLVKNFDELSQRRQDVLSDIAYNIGETSFRGFKKSTIPAIERGDFKEAARLMAKSKWAKDVGVRATELIAIMRDG